MTVRRELERGTGRCIAIGAVYITLDRLEAKGLVTSERTVAAADSPSRRVFAVTPAGAKALAETRTVRDRLWEGVSLRAVIAAATAGHRAG